MIRVTTWTTTFAELDYRAAHLKFEDGSTISIQVERVIGLPKPSEPNIIYTPNCSIKHFKEAAQAKALEERLNFVSSPTREIDLVIVLSDVLHVRHEQAKKIVSKLTELREQFKAMLTELREQFEAFEAFEAFARPAPFADPQIPIKQTTINRGTSWGAWS